MKRDNTSDQSRRTLYTSLLLLLLAILLMTAATTAWLTLGDRARVYSMVMDVTSGANLRFDLDPHPDILEYTRTLNFEAIAARIFSEKGFNPADTPLMPVTTTDYAEFSDENGKLVEAESGNYLEFTLHFIAEEDMIVHLTSANSTGKSDGTHIGSDVQTLPAAMRISFTDGANTVVYDPGSTEPETIYGARVFGLPSPDKMTYSDDNALFPLQKRVDKPIIVRIWMEGTDEACDDSLQKASYSITLRFEGTDENNQLFQQSTYRKS